MASKLKIKLIIDKMNIGNFKYVCLFFNHLITTLLFNSITYHHSIIFLEIFTHKLLSCKIHVIIKTKSYAGESMIKFIIIGDMKVKYQYHYDTYFCGSIKLYETTDLTYTYELIVDITSTFESFDLDWVVTNNR